MFEQGTQDPKKRNGVFDEGQHYLSTIDQVLDIPTSNKMDY